MTCDNNELDKGDKMAKVRSLYSLINERCLLYYPSKQFIKGKPVRYGFKVWRLCTSLGYIVQFEPYAGAGEVRIPEVGVGGSVVLDLISELPPFNWHLTFDNYFTTLNLIAHLKDRGIGACGTIRTNRLKKCPVDTKAVSKANRGNFD